MPNKNLIVLNPLVSRAEDLAKEHEHIYKKYVVPGRLKLYGLLQKIMQLSEAIDASADKDQLINHMRIQLKNKHQIKTQDNSSAEAVLVRFVTRADRKSAHVYARSIETAKTNGVKSSDFVNYVKEKGGIERIREKGVDPEVRKANKDIDAKQMQDMWEFMRIVSKNPCANFKLPDGKKKWHSTSSLHYFVACKIDGEYKVIAEVPVDEEQETLLLQPFKEMVSEQLKNDPESLIKLKKFVEAKELKLNAKNLCQEGDKKCAA